MRTRIGLLLAAATIVAGMTAVGVGPAAANGISPGSFTKITTPSGTTTLEFDAAPGAMDNHLTVSGVASTNLPDVDIDCLYTSLNGVVQIQTLASKVPVTGGSFSTVASYPSTLTNCRLRAIPTGYAQSYLAAFSGPILYMYMTSLESVADNVPVGYTATDEDGTGYALAQDAGTCGATVMATIQTPQMQVESPEPELCRLFLAASNITASGSSTASAIQVSGQNAYLPAGIAGYLNVARALAVQQSRLTVTSARASNGDLTITESAPLMRCKTANTYPPNTTSCPSLVATGVTFKRVTSMVHGAHQVRFRDSFTSTDGAAHTIGLQYQAESYQPIAGLPGYAFPGHGGSFKAVTPGEAVSGLGTKAGTLLARSDLYSTEGDPQAETVGITWSRAPTKVQFAVGSTADYALPYSLTVPKRGTAYLGFAVTDRLTTALTRTLAQTAVGEMINAPTITSPHNRAIVHGKTTIVTGRVAVGANGLPTTVTVDGHRATLKAVKGAETYRAKFKEPYGAHTIKVVARDAAGNAAITSIKIRNKR